MKYSRKDELAILERILATKDDPLAFAMIAYPWGEPHTPLASVTGPRAWQRDELEQYGAHLRTQSKRFALGLPLEVYRSAWSSGRGPGKSAEMAIIAHHHVSTHWGGQAIVAANTETQLRKKTFPEIARWVAMSLNAHWFNVDGMEIRPAEWLREMVADQLKVDHRYWSIVGQTWVEENPSAFAGAHNQYGLLVMFDEASGIPGGVWDTADGFFSDPTPYRAMFAASQMRRPSGRFYDLFYDERMGAGWHRRTMDIEGMEGVDQEWVRSFIARHGADSDEVRIEIRGLPPKMGDMQLLAMSDMVAAAERNLPDRDLGAPLILGVDPAPRGRTVMRFRQGRNARDCCGRDTRIELNGWNNVQIADKIAQLDRRYHPDAICIDFGMGTGVIDILRENGVKVLEVKFGEAAYDKDGEWALHGHELWAALVNWIPGGMIEATGAEGFATLAADLTKREWRWQNEQQKKKVLESKEDLKARGIPSPDDADALACTFEYKGRARARSSGRGKVADGATKWD